MQFRILIILFCIMLSIFDTLYYAGCSINTAMRLRRSANFRVRINILIGFKRKRHKGLVLKVVILFVGWLDFIIKHGIDWVDKQNI